MIGRPTSYLGLAVSDRGIACAEVSSGGAQRSVRRTAMFAFTPELSLETGAATGQALASFLRENRFSATRAVVGVPARWLIAGEKDVPPIGAEQARAMLRIQAERQSNGETGEMVFDFAGETSTSAASRVLLVGISKPQLNRVEQIIDAAGLSIAAITSTGMALAGTLNHSDRDTTMLLLLAGGGEMVIRQGGSVKMLRHVAMIANGHGTPAIAPLGAELRRTIALGAAGPNNRELTLMDGVGLGREQLAELSDRAGVPLRAGDEIKLLGLSRDGALASGADAAAAQGYIFPSVALALAGSKISSLPLDFAHSKLAPAPVKRIGRLAMYGIIFGGVAIIGLIALYLTIRARQAELDDINAKIQIVQPTLADARHVIDRASYAEGYSTSRPKMIECLRQLSLIYGDNSRIWVDTLSVRDNGRCVLSGKSSDQQTVLDMVEKLKKNPKFSEVQRLDVHEADARTHEWTYSLNFTFNLNPAE